MDLGRLYGRVARSVEELKLSFHIKSATSGNSFPLITITSAESSSLIVEKHIRRRDRNQNKNNQEILINN